MGFVEEEEEEESAETSESSVSDREYDIRTGREHGSE